MGEIQRRGDETVAQAIGVDRRGGARRPLLRLGPPLRSAHALRRRRSRSPRAYPRAPYNGEIAWTDELVGRLLDHLDRRGLDRRTLVVVMGDHGESLGEHGEADHGFFVYDATQQRPLPARRPLSRASPARW